MSNNESLTYKDAGVDIDAGAELVDKIKTVATRTKRPEVMSGLGGFGALCELPTNYKEPVLVTGTDGVGTKLKLAMDIDKHDTIGIDLVAMCVNDLIVTGAEPLVFLDYYATGKLDVNIAAEVVTGIGAGCEQAGCSLVGGETAEMPGMYDSGDYDLAGFCVGVVEKSKIIDGSSVRVGDALIGLPSSGVHSNGFSLVRKILETRDIDPLNTKIDGESLADLLIEPTKIYVKPLLQLLKTIDVHAISHITGGGLIENLPRVLSGSVKAVVNQKSWQPSALFRWLQKEGNISDKEMLRTFNCGIGMVLVVPEAEASATIDLFHAMGEEAILIGEILAASEGDEQLEIYN